MILIRNSSADILMNAASPDLNRNPNTVTSADTVKWQRNLVDNINVQVPDCDASTSGSEAHGSNTKLKSAYST